MSEHRFWGHVDRGESCWLWVGALTDLGYGRVRRAGRECLAHRVAWELTYGPIPPARRVRHLCHEPACVNPRHLALGPLARLPGDIVKKIRESPLRHAVVARQLRVHKWTVSRIRRGLRVTYT